MTVSKSGFEPVAATVLLTFCEKLRTVPSDHFRGGVNGFFILHKSYLPSSTPISISTMPNSTRRRIGNRAALVAVVVRQTAAMHGWPEDAALAATTPFCQAAVC